MKKPTFIQITLMGTIGTLAGVFASFFVGMVIWFLLSIAGYITGGGVASKALLMPILSACIAIGSLIGLAVGIQDAKDNPR